MNSANRCRQINFDQALLNPSAFFITPEDLLEYDTLSKQQKIELLRQWQYDASSIAVAEEEGMINDKELLQQRILQALHKLAGRVDVEHTGPTKQSSL